MRGVQENMAPSANVCDFLTCLESYGEADAITSKYNGSWRKHSYVELVQTIHTLSSKLSDEYVNRTNMVVVGDNSYEWIVAFLAITLSGNTAVPIDKELADSEILRQIGSSGCKTLFYSSSICDLIEQNHELLSHVRNIVRLDDSEKKLPTPHFVSFYDYIGKQEKRFDYERHIIADDIASLIVFTSGTTEAAKGVMLSEKNVFSAVNSALEYITASGTGISVLPLNHTYGLSCTMVMLKLKMHIILNDKVKNFAKNTKEFKPTTIVLVPIYVEKIFKSITTKLKQEKKLSLVTRMIGISNFLRRLKIDVRRKLFKQIIAQFGGELELMVCGGAPLYTEYVEFFHAIGINLTNGYGITECAPFVSVNPIGKTKYGSVGSVLSCCQVHIQKESEGNDGEIWVSGDNVMIGYFNDPERTKNAMDGDWFKTGDLGRLDKDGYLYISGRSKNTIVLKNGKNVQPEEIEEKIKRNPLVEEVVVYCSGNDVISLEYYSPSGEIIDIKNLIESVNRELPLYAQIGNVSFRSSPFAKTATQKIKRDQINFQGGQQGD